MAIFDVDLLEPVNAGITVDRATPTADNGDPRLTADGGPLIGAVDVGDANVNFNVIRADISEPVGGEVTADETIPTADYIDGIHADGGVGLGARESVDAEVISAIIAEPGGGIPYPKRLPLPVIGRGHGILPRPEGEAFGVVGAVGKSIAKLSLASAANGSIGVIGRSAGELAIIRAKLLGQHGQVGTGNTILKTISVASDGTIAACGSGLVMIAKLQGTAIGRHDDDEAAVMTFLLAA